LGFRIQGLGFKVSSGLRAWSENSKAERNGKKKKNLRV
jgi:hypothetical protein